MKHLKDSNHGNDYKRFVEHNGKKFRITHNQRNGSPLGFDTRFKIEVMTLDGWKIIAGKADVDFLIKSCYTNSDLHLHNEALEFFKACEAHIELLY